MQTPCVLRELLLPMRYLVAPVVIWSFKAYGGEDQVTVNNYFSGSYVRHVKFAFDDRTVEHFDYNQYVANANNLIQAMASFGSNNGSGLSSTSTMSNPANPLLAASTL